jgi:peptidoglycan/LPS O-acetylase OafA/YrhL
MFEAQAAVEVSVVTRLHHAPARPATKLRLRPDIEGLRALAILLVVGFHAGIPWLRGGFVGVDIFFVLSGYLITELLVKEIESTGKLDFAGFYARRCRRLLPASFVMLICVLIASLAILSPIEVIPLAKGSMAIAAYSSNLWFLSMSTNYFSPNVDTNPLLHTWSLAVEEQFYFAWPLLVWLCMKSATPRRTTAKVLWTVVVLSLISSVWFTRALPSVAFFGTPIRAWEFAAGGLASLIQGHAFVSLRRNNVGSWIGAAILIGSGCLLTTKGFPGALALIPVIGTILLLITGKYSTSGHGISRLLACKPLQILGGLSYSWYLWHWPFFVFGRILWPQKSPFLLSTLLATGSLVVAWVSHKLVENPIRFNKRLARNPVFSLRMGAGLTIASILAGLGSLMISRHASQSPRNAMFIDAARNNTGGEHGCLVGFRSEQPTTCSFGPSGGKTVILFGDSHADQWLPALRNAAQQKQWHLVTLFKAACPSVTVPVFNPNLGREEYECDRWRTRALAYIKDQKPSMVIISNATGYVKRPDGQDPYMRLPVEAWQQGTRSTLEALSGTAAAVVLLRDTPRPEIDVPTCLSRSRSHPRLFPASLCNVERRKALPQFIWQAELAAGKGIPNLSIVDMTADFCGEDNCPPMLNGLVVYRDGNHMTSTFASSLGPELADKLGSIENHEANNVQPPVTAPPTLPTAQE